MSANFMPGDDGDWTDASTRDVAASLYERWMQPFVEAHAVRLDEHLQRERAKSSPLKDQDVADEVTFFWKTSGMSRMEDIFMRRAKLAARRLRSGDMSPLPMRESEFDT